MSRELRLRIVSAIVMAAVILAATWYGGILFRIVAGLLAILIYYEWSTVTRLSETNSTGNAWAGSRLPSSPAIRFLANRHSICRCCQVLR